MASEGEDEASEEGLGCKALRLGVTCDSLILEEKDQEMGSLYMSTGWVANPCAQLLLLELPLTPADSGLVPPWRQYGPAWVPSATLASPGVTWRHLASPGGGPFQCSSLGGEPFRCSSLGCYVPGWRTVGGLCQWQE